MVSTIAAVLWLAQCPTDLCLALGMPVQSYATAVDCEKDAAGLQAGGDVWGWCEPAPTDRCPTEDSCGCRWDALRMGDGTGHSFVCVWLPDSRQTVIYDEGGSYTYD